MKSLVQGECLSCDKDYMFKGHCIRVTSQLKYNVGFFNLLVYIIGTLNQFGDCSFV